MSLDAKLGALLRTARDEGGFDDILLTTAEGMVLAAASDTNEDQDAAAAFCSLFETAFLRAGDDLGFDDLDELTLHDKDRRRYVIRPVDAETFVVVRLAPRQRWRRATNRLLRGLRPVLSETSALE